MIQKTTWRGCTQEVANQNSRHAEEPLLSISTAKIKSHSRGSLPGIPTPFTIQGGDPEQKRFRMTSFLIPPHPAYGHPLPQGRGERPRGFTARSVTPQCRCAGYSGRVGFTLIELLVVVLIIGILAAVALPQYNKVVKKAQGREVLVALDALDKAMENYYLEHGTYNGANIAETLNIDLPELKYWRYNDSASHSPTWETGTSQFNGVLVDGSKGDGAYIWVLLKDKILSVTTYYSKGNIKERMCYANRPHSCSDYFNCNTEAWHEEEYGYRPGTYWVGGSCSLK